MKRRLLALLLAGTMAAGVLAGCGNNSSKNEGKSEGTTENQNADNQADEAADDAEEGTEEVKGSDEGSGDITGTVDIFQYKVEINDALKAATEKYMELNPGVTINLETVGGGDDYGAALRTRMQASDQPEIFNIGGPQDVIDWEANLADLSAEGWVGNTVEGLLDDVTKDGKVYGMPLAIEGYGFVYNKEIFEAAGIDVAALKTYEDIDKAFGDLKAKIDNGDLKEQFPALEAVIEYPAKEKWVLGMHTGNIALGQEFANCTEAFNAKEVEFKYAAELKDLIDLQIKYTVNADNPAALNAVDYSMQAGGGLAIERVAAIQQGNWVYPIIAEVDSAVAEKLGIIPMPLKGVSEGNTPVGVPMYWAVNSQSDEKDQAAARDFLNWLYQSEEGMQIVVNDFGFIPPLTNFGDAKPSDPLGQAISEAANAGTIAPWVFNGCPTSWAENVLGAEIQSYIGGDKTWEEAVESAKQSWKESR
ncbi:MAG: extracellular solute-binding protein [Lachnospiraceae bacterium]|nr:extracellular solute-binding protein [Lachnospiraceae bacterium]